jgi:hypothetical protein
MKEWVAGVKAVIKTDFQKTGRAARGDARPTSASEIVFGNGSKGRFRCQETEVKRHRAAALHDADATDFAPLRPRGFGVRQSYAAFVVAPGGRALPRVNGIRHGGGLP